MGPERRARGSIAICIPARDEAAELPGLFAALEALTVPPGSAVHICLMLDRCTDDSPALAAAYRRTSRHRVVVATATGGTVGAVRAEAMAAGLATLTDGAGLLLATDADSRPARDWLTRMQAALCVADIVAGRIVRARGRGGCALQDRVERYYDALFALRRALDPVPWEAPATHHFTGAANLGVRAGAYRAAGGFRPLAAGEDARLVDDAARAGLRVRRDAACVVTTSDRRTGRAARGLAHALAQGDRGDASAIRVAHPADAAWQYRMHEAARTGFAAARPGCVAALLGLSVAHVEGVARDCPNAEAFAMRIVPAPPGGMRELTLPAAEAALAMLSQPRRAA